MGVRISWLMFGEELALRFACGFGATSGGGELFRISVGMNPRLRYVRTKVRATWSRMLPSPPRGIRQAP